MINITDVKIRRLLHDGRLRAIVSVTLDDAIALHDIKVIEGRNRLFVAVMITVYTGILCIPSPHKKETQLKIGFSPVTSHPLPRNKRLYLKDTVPPESPAVLFVKKNARRKHLAFRVGVVYEKASYANIKGEFP